MTKIKPDRSVDAYLALSLADVEKIAWYKIGLSEDERVDIRIDGVGENRSASKESFFTKSLSNQLP